MDMLLTVVRVIVIIICVFTFSGLIGLIGEAQSAPQQAAAGAMAAAIVIIPYCLLRALEGFYQK